MNRSDTDHDLVDALSRLRAFGTPSIANALESLGFDPSEGFTDASIGPLTTGRPFVGRVLTATMVSAAAKGAHETTVATERYWRYVADHAGPTIVVVQDLDPIPVGAMFGEVQGRLHRALGVVGIVTNGAVRDLTELSAIGLPVLGGRACVSHAFARFREIDVPVTIGGLEIQPGDTVHADRHGVQRIPVEARLEDVARVAGEIEALEAELFAAAEPGVDLDVYLQTWTAVRSRWPSRSDAVDGAI